MTKHQKSLIVIIILTTLVMLFFVTELEIPKRLPMIVENTNFNYKKPVTLNKIRMNETINDYFKMQNELCKTSKSLELANNISKRFMEGKKGREECDILNGSDFIQINYKDNYFCLKLNIDDLTKETKIDKKRVKCKVESVDKSLNISESFINVITKTKTFSKKEKYELCFSNHGYYYAYCYKSVNVSLKIYEDTYLILPKNMSKLVDERLKYKKLEKKGNNLTYEADNDDQYLKFLDTKNNLLLEKKMNVLMLGFDSLSYQHFQRVMPITFNYLTKSLENNIMFNSMNRVGENTFPNLAAILSGIFITDIPSINVTSEFQMYKNIDAEFFDKYPFIWYRYENASYLTAFQVCFSYI